MNSATDGALVVEYENVVHAPYTDSLTGLFNHGYFLVALEHEIKRYERHGSPFTLGLVDVDWFSNFNKKFGSFDGDRMLKNIAHTIASTIRDVDIAARYQGDVFAVILVMAETEEAATAGERLCNAVEKMTGAKVTLSVGLASCCEGVTPLGLISRAREALARAKARGKNRLCLYEEQQSMHREARPRVLVVDDEPVNQKLMESLLLTINYEVLKASNGEEALHVVHKTDPDLILLDAMMPGMDGFEVCRRLKAHHSTRLIPIIMLTALNAADAKLRGIEAGADDFITKPPNRAELLARTKSLLNAKFLNDNLASIENVLISLANAIEARDAGTQGHVQRVANLAHDLGSRMGLSKADQKALRLGGILHDIGKIHIPDDILNKPGPLTPEERKIMEAHAEESYRICLPLKKSLGAALEAIYYHHEKLDGSGYPEGLKSAEIPMVARIMAVVDIYDALVSDRPYRNAISPEQSMRILNQMVADGKLDADIVGHLTAIIVG
ncbi:MAG: HD domain-containing phosphohydrolase [Syntrophobacteraceae bacterium]|jgi:putative two-component system response regulator